MNKNNMETVAILDYGSQYTQLIARRVRELNIYSEIFHHSISINKLLQKNIKCIILSGGPNSVYDIKSPQLNPEILNLNIPILGICYGLQLLLNNTVDLLLTDPPYGVDYSQKNEFLNKFDEGNRIQTDMRNDNIENIKQFCSNFLSIIPFSDYNIFYIFFDGLQLHRLREAIEESNLKFSQYLIWNKNNHILGRQDYLNKHEFILYGWKNRHKFYDPH